MEKVCEIINLSGLKAVYNSNLDKLIYIFQLHEICECKLRILRKLL
jgi:hypothetical protein